MISERLRKSLKENEKIVCTVQGYDETYLMAVSATLVATDQRILFFTNDNTDDFTEEIPFDAVSYCKLSRELMLPIGKTLHLQKKNGDAVRVKFSDGGEAFAEYIGERLKTPE